MDDENLKSDVEEVDIKKIENGYTVHISFPICKTIFVETLENAIKIVVESFDGNQEDSE